MYARRAWALGVALTLAASPRLGAQQELISWRVERAVPGIGGRVSTLGFSYDGSALAVGSTRGDLVIVPLRSQAAAARTRLPRGVTSIAFSRDGREVAIGTNGAGAQLLDRATAALRPVGPTRNAGRSVAVSPEGDVVAVATERDGIGLYALNGGAEVARLPRAHERGPLFLMFRGRGETLVSVGEDRQIIEWDSRTGQRRRQLSESEPFLMGVSGSPGADWLVVGTENTQLTGYRGGQGAVRSGVAYLDRIKIYNLESGVAEKIIENVLVEPRRLSLSADYKVMAVAERDTRRSTVGLWDVERGVRIGEIPVPAQVTDVAFSPDGAWLAVGDESGTVQLFSVRGIQPRLAYTGNLTGRKYVVTSPQTPLVTPSRRMRLAVLALDDNGVGAPVTNAIADQLVNRLSANPGVRLVERRRLAAILGEQDLQRSGRTDPTTAVALARILNVEKVIVGAVARLGTTMTITAQLVDVETAAIDGVREVQCNACELQDLSEAVAELSQVLVGDGSALSTLPSPPEIFLNDGITADSTMATDYIVRGRITYSGSLQSVELIVNGSPVPASRALDLGAGRGTPLAGGRTQMTFTQRIPLTGETTVIALRALAADGNDEQRYIRVTQLVGAAAPTRGAALPPLTLQEVLDAIEAGATRALPSAAAESGLAFPLDAAAVDRLRAAGASDALLTALRRAAAPRPGSED
jgi:WD40 repeat protein